MAAIADWSAYLAGRINQQSMAVVTKDHPTPSGGKWGSTWGQSPLAGSTPSTAAALTKATTGALGGSELWQNSSGSTQQWLLGADVRSWNPGVYMLVDRLSHNGGMSAVTPVSPTANTTNLPTAALPRYTSGAGVMLGVEIYTIIGTTGVTISASYTNQAGTAGQATPAVVFGGTGFREAGRMLLLPLAAGDTGVRAVASTTISATTGTAGNFGVVLFKPLMWFAVMATQEACDPIVSGNCGGGIPEIADDACLCLYQTSTLVNLGRFQGQLLMSEV